MGLTDRARSIFNSSIDIFYPNECQVCRAGLAINEKFICLICQYDLPYISQNNYEVTQLNKRFWGRTKVEKVYSLFNYQRGNAVSSLLQQIKYHGKTKLAIHLGKELGEQIQDAEFDTIVPIPLHPKKQQKRGYNQSAMIVKGMSDSLGVEANLKAVKRVQYNRSQTKYSKYDRWENVRSIFEIVKPKQLENKHVLLVDDVLTTGATLEACIQQLNKVKGCKVSVATLAARL